MIKGSKSNVESEEYLYKDDALKFLIETELRKCINWKLSQLIGEEDSIKMKYKDKYEKLIAPDVAAIMKKYKKYFDAVSFSNNK